MLSGFHFRKPRNTTFTLKKQTLISNNWAAEIFIHLKNNRTEHEHAYRQASLQQQNNQDQPWVICHVTTGVDLIA